MYSRKELANSLRALSIDAIEQANSGHPGAPMGMADIMEVLWRDFFKHNPLNPKWPNRDRFVLSNGHASALLYSILHLTGYNLSMDELKNFRKLGSKTPGHPELGSTEGIDVTTGPLGQGLANAVGIAIAERTLGAYFNRQDYSIVDHYTWAFVGDGCLMEGISHESCSLAGTLELGKLIVFYDSNKISIDGPVVNWFSENIKKRFEAYNWHVVENVDGHNSKSIFNAILEAKKNVKKPSIIICKTIIGFGSPNKSNREIVHGAPLGKVESNLTKKNIGWKYPEFFIPEDMYNVWNAQKKGQVLEKKWKDILKNYKKEYPKLSLEYKRRICNLLPENWNKKMNFFINELQNNPEIIATRQSSQKILSFIGKILPELIGGSADLSPSNLTMHSNSVSIKNNHNGNYIHYGVREFGMTAISNGISVYGGFIPYSATFLVFSEYAKNAIRMAALMKIQQIFIYTHDSIGLGEDGPTHQPIEQLSHLRLTPNLSVWRPSDQVETAVAWKFAIERKKGPTALILSRQNLKQFKRTNKELENVSKGAYIIKEAEKCQPNLILISTGSELFLTLKVSKKIDALGYSCRVISMPSSDKFEEQSKEYKQYLFPKKIKKRIAIEAGITDFWHKYVGLEGKIIGINRYGDSASGEVLFSKFGFTVEHIVKKIKLFLNC
ncbi:transketolase [Buchnera aphidicola (Mindarus keteleerifoliae)]|uniref:transketolase n=1 Tax=Buchnera aphidicola TaxID=9 RepID=UPI0031B6B073